MYTLSVVWCRAQRDVLLLAGSAAPHGYFQELLCVYTHTHFLAEMAAKKWSGADTGEALEHFLAEMAAKKWSVLRRIEENVGPWF